MKKTLLARSLSVILILGLLSGFITSKNVTAENVTPQLIVSVDQAVLNEIALSGSASYWINFRSKVDLSSANKMDWSARGWYVYDQLQKTANESQAQVQKYLNGSKTSFQSFWINNSILVEGSGLSVLNSLQVFAEVESIEARKNYILYEPERRLATKDIAVSSIEPNIARINADDVWALGFDGSGLVVANIDTGVRYTHQALVKHYRGNNGDDSFTHDYNWFDPYEDHSSPADDHGHGTHTMGTMVGNDGGDNQIGVAPGASWMACRGCSGTSCSDAALLSCGQFIAAPTDLEGSGPKPDLRPNVVNNSWGDCSTMYDPWYADVIDAWQDAGIYPIFSNGNASNCGYSSPPGLNTVGNPARYGNVTGVGSSGEQDGKYADHSTWGPTDNLDTINPTSGFDELKPQVIAPGVDIRSSTPGSDTEYQDGWTGTSMSAPHVAGLVALIWQAAPCLLGDYAATENLIESTAFDITYDDGSISTTIDFPNYATGWGEIDALAAVDEAIKLCSTVGTLTGTVTDGTTPLEEVNIHVDLGGGITRNVLTQPDGTYTLILPEGKYTVTASKYGYSDVVISSVVITIDMRTKLDFILTPLATSLVSGYVYDGGVVGIGKHGYPLYSAIHILATSLDETIYTDPFTGYYEIELLDSVTYSFNIEVIPSGYDSHTENLTPSGTSFSKDFTMVVGGACSAPGYIPLSIPALTERFDGSTLPVGWVNNDYMGNGQVWQFNDPYPRGNLTPGAEGGFAILDSDAYGYGGNQDAGLRTPPINFSGKESVILDFDTDFYYLTGSSAIVRVSVDSGSTWNDVWVPAASVRNSHVTLDISTHAAGHTNVIIEFKYVGSYDWWWEIDDVVVSSINCQLATGGVVAGYVYDDNTKDPIIGADVNSADVATQSFELADDHNNMGLYWVFQPISSAAPTSALQSLSGSNVVFDPTAGGTPGFTPGVPTTLCFESNVYTPDWAYMNDTWLKFPPDWTITDIYLVGTPTCDNGGNWGLLNDVFWETEPYEIDIHHIAYPFLADHCVADYCVVLTPGASAGLVSWYYDGDNYGSTPYHPCSNDVYTPASMVAEPCDQSVNPQASIPVIGGQLHDFIAQKELYGSDTQSVYVKYNSIVQQDFYLGSGQLIFDPTTLDVTITIGDEPVTETLSISNLGTSDATFKLVERDEGFVLPSPMIQAFEGELPERSSPVSLGRAPQSAMDPSINATWDNPMKGILSGEPAYAVDLAISQLKYIPDTTVPGSWNNIGWTADYLVAGDFLAGDFTTLYAISSDNNNLYTVEVATGAATLVGLSTPPSGQTWTGLSGSPDGRLYGLTSNVSVTTLVIVDPNTGVVTPLSELPGLKCGIDLAYNTDDDMIYIVDIVTDNLFKVDPNTLTTTIVGNLGINANYHQGLDYEEDSGVLYWAAYNFGTSVGELRIIDTTTGASALVGAFPGGTQVDCLAFPTGGFYDVTWFSENPVSGTVLGDNSIVVDVIFDPTGANLTQPGDYLAALKVKHDTPYTYPLIPVLLHLVENTPPVAQGQSVTTNESVQVSIMLVATDLNGHSVTYSVVDGPSHGTLSGLAPNLTYTPVSGWIGEDSFTFKANDGFADSNVATVNITVYQTTKFIYLPMILR